MHGIDSILLLDDDPQTLTILSELFKTLQIPRICTVATAKEALDAVKKESFTIIISDYHLGEMSGVEFLENIRGKGDATPVIMLSGNPDSEGVVRALNLPNVAFLSKPFKLTDLVAIIDQFV